jgi:hypothetical protein
MTGERKAGRAGSGGGLVAAILLLLPGWAWADSYAAVGFGVKDTNGTAYQVATNVYKNFELHFTSWNGDDHSQGVGIGYRWQGPHGLSAVLGAAYLGRISDNLLSHADAYIEVRWRFLDRYSCQLGHYSTIGDDQGENVFLCGMHFDWDFAGAVGWPRAGEG